jgi:hypothetical protein
MNEKIEIVLSDNHKRSLSVVARHIANGIDEIESLLLNSGNKNSTSKVIKNMDEEDRKSILNLLMDLKSENNLMVDSFSLKPEILYEDRMVIGKISHLWVLLSDSTSKGLKRYGKLSGMQSDIIDRHINKLLNIINKIQSVLSP